MKFIVSIWIPYIKKIVPIDFGEGQRSFWVTEGRIGKPWKSLLNMVSQGELNMVSQVHLTHVVTTRMRRNHTGRGRVASCLFGSIP